MAWGAEVAATQLTGIGATRLFFDETPIVPDRGAAHVQVAVDFPTTPTSAAQVDVYGRVGSTWDTTPLISVIVPNAPDPGVVSIPVPNGIYQIRVGVVRSGGSDTTIVADMSYRLTDQPD